MADAIKAERLVLRPLERADGDVVIAGLNDFEVVKWLANPPYPFAERDLRLTKEDGLSRWPDLAGISRAGDLIGVISGQPHLGFWLLRKHWGQGFATEAARAMIARIFNETDAATIASGYFEGNHASARVLEKLGFTEVARAPHSCVSRDALLPHVSLELSRQVWEVQP